MASLGGGGADLKMPSSFCDAGDAADAADESK